MSAKVVLAYTAGLESSVCLHWLRHKKNFKVITFSANLGMGEKALEEVGALALASGAESAHVVDLREKFARDFILPAIRANACYEAGYYLAVAMSRPLIVREMAKIAEENGCQYVAHGGVRTGNDRARFETAVADLDPTLDVIFPPAEWNLASRSEEEEYAKRFQLRYRKRDRAGYYTLDENMWGRTVRWEGLDDGWLAPPPEAYYLTVDPREAPDEPTEVTIRFAAGVPVALDGEKLEPVALIQRMNQIGGRHGVGRTDIVENPLSGVKKRQTYEAPAAHILITAHQALEDVVLPKEILHFQKPLSQKYSELIYEGFWFDDIRLALDDFFLRIQKRVVGEVRVRLFKGSSLVTGRRAS